MRKLKVIIVGCGGRGTNFSKIFKALPEQFEVVAIAEPIDHKREYIRNFLNVPEDMCFYTWEDVLYKEKFADVVVVTTMDRDHYAPTMAAIEKGYDLLLEKPVTSTAKECYEIADAAEKKGVKILVCHSLRYDSFYRKVKELIDTGKVGRVMTIEANEGVGNIHQSHSFVRGDWSNKDESSFMLLQKCCHDLDMLQWMIGKKCTRVHSFGSLGFFNNDNAPEGAPEYCYDNCPHADTCYYNAEKVYALGPNEFDWMRNRAIGKQKPTEEDLYELLHNTKYGKCVFRSNNNVVDHQVVNMEFEDGATVSFNMNAFNKGDRRIRVFGTDGELYGSLLDQKIEIFNFADRTTETYNIDYKQICYKINPNHYGDVDIAIDLYKYITGEIGKEGLSEISVSAENHMICFAAEHSRLTGNVVDVDEYIKNVMK